MHIRMGERQTSGANGSTRVSPQIAPVDEDEPRLA